MPYTRRTGTLLGVVAVFLTVAACSSSTSGHPATRSSASAGSSSPSASVTSAPASPTSSSAPAAATGLARIPVQPGDLPTGWHATPASSDAGDAAQQAKLIACVGGKNTHSDQLGKVEKDYEMGDSQITSSATRFRSQADIAADTALLHSSKINSCYAKEAAGALKSSLPAGTAVRHIAFSIKPGSAGGPANVIATGRGTVAIAKGSQTVTLFVDVAFMTGPRIEAEADFTTLGAPVDAGLRQKAITAVAKRAARG